MLDTSPYALQDSNVLRRRRAMLSQPNIKPLHDFTNAMRDECGEGYIIPDFDPLDGGIQARALLLFEAPGGGVADTMMISRENPDRVATLFRKVIEESGVSRQNTVIWNLVPRYVAEGVSDGDVAEALPYLRQLIGLLPRLEVIVLFGARASSLKKLLSNETDCHVIATWMPSPRVFNRWKNKKREVEEAFQELALRLRS